MFRADGPRRGLAEFVDWMDGQWDAGPFGGASMPPPLGGQPRRRGRGLMGALLGVLALVAAERLFFRRRRGHRSMLGSLFYVVLAVTLSAAATSAWRRQRPSSWWRAGSRCVAERCLVSFQR